MLLKTQVLGMSRCFPRVPWVLIGFFEKEFLAISNSPNNSQINSKIENHARQINQEIGHCVMRLFSVKRIDNKLYEISGCIKEDICNKNI